MKIIIGGGSGFVGRLLVPALLDSGNEVTVIGRDKSKILKIFPKQVQAIEWNDLSSLDAANFDATINLTGVNIAEKRWSDQVKAEIISSRVNSVLSLIEWCKKSSGIMPHLYSASAVGYYGLQSAIPEKGLLCTEDSNISSVADHSFSCRLVNEWETSARIAEKEKIPLTVMRFGVVLHRGEGMLKQLELPAKFGMSAVLGAGLQPISWISADDLVNSIQFLLTHPEMTGVFNLVAPEVVTQKTFSKSLAAVVKRPAFLWMPAWLVKLLFGQMGEELLLSGQAVLPHRLLRQKFVFKHPTLLEALNHEFNKTD